MSRSANIRCHHSSTSPSLPAAKRAPRRAMDARHGRAALPAEEPFGPMAGTAGATGSDRPRRSGRRQDHQVDGPASGGSSDPYDTRPWPALRSPHSTLGSPVRSSANWGTRGVVAADHRCGACRRGEGTSGRSRARRHGWAGWKRATHRLDRNGAVAVCSLLNSSLCWLWTSSSVGTSSLAYC